MTEATFIAKLKESAPEMPESFHEAIEDTMEIVFNIADINKQTECHSRKDTDDMEFRNT